MQPKSKQLTNHSLLMPSILMALLWISCSLLVGQDSDIREDVPYRTPEQPGYDAYAAERCRLDLYLPEGNGKSLPVLVWFHGGGLRGGEKSIPERLKNQGLIIAAPNYRLFPKVESPVYIEDAAAAVAWIIKHIEPLGGNPRRVFVSGHSAGGYLTSMIGLDKQWLGAHGEDANVIAGLIPFSGHTITHFTPREEKGVKDTQPIIDAMAPLFHIRADAPPLILITGDRNMEMLGRYEENAYMMRMMQVIGDPATKLYELQGYGHGMTEPAFPILLREIKSITKSLNAAEAKHR